MEQVIDAVGATLATTAVVFVGTKVVMVDAQPVNVLVTTHWYVPPKLTVPVVVAAPAIAPRPVHAYDTGVIVVDALTCDVKLVQVIEPVFDELTTGIPTLGITETVPEFVQPFVGLVTVNV